MPRGWGPQLWPLVGQWAGANKYCSLNAPPPSQNTAMFFQAKTGQITGQKRQGPETRPKFQAVAAWQGAKLAKALATETPPKRFVHSLPGNAPRILGFLNL